MRRIGRISFPRAGGIRTVSLKTGAWCGARGHRGLFDSYRGVNPVSIACNLTGGIVSRWNGFDSDFSFLHK